MTEASGPAPSPRLSPGAVLWIAVSIGLLSGVGELVLLGFDRYVSGDLIFVSRDFLWMAPVGTLGFALLLSAVLVAVTGGKTPLRGAVFVPVALGAFGWMVKFEVLHPIASLVVAAGVGKVISDLVCKGGEGTVTTFRRLSTVLLALVLVAMVGNRGAQWMGERSAVGGLADAAPDAPNVLLITMDTVRAKSLGLHGHSRPTTPEMEKLAAEGTVFDRAIATAPWTLPTHSSLMTGRFHCEMPVNWDTGLDDEFPTIAEKLSAKGYATAGFVSNLNYTAYEVGMNRGFGFYRDYPVSLGQIVLSCSFGRWLTNNVFLRELIGNHENLNRKTADTINGEFLDWLDGRDKERPFFAFLNYYDAHQPYLPPEEWLSKFRPEDPVARTGFRYDTNLIEIEKWEHISAAQKVLEEDCYDAAIAYLDDRIGKLFGALREQGLLDDTLVILTADHGEQFGEHELYNHGNSLYMPSIHVPLIMRWPGKVPFGRRISRAVSLRNIPDTILTMTGSGSADEFQGDSLARHWDPAVKAEDLGEIVLSECFVLDSGKRQGWTRSLLVGDMHFIRNGDEGDASDELYNIAADPEQIRDLAGEATGGASLPIYRQLMDAQPATPKEK